jgi:hypothetical protein
MSNAYLKWSPQFQAASCNDWLIGLQQENVIEISASVGNFKTPFIIQISKKISKNISEIYAPHEERGGLMFASVKSKNDETILKIESVHEVRNDVEKYFNNSSKSSSYYPNREDYLKLLSDNFSNKNSKGILLPIHFHTHPTRNTVEDIRYHSQIIHPLNPSEADITVSNLRHIQLNNFTLLYLNSIITGDSMEHRIMFYGRKVTPEDYTREKGRQIINTVMEATDGIQDHDLRVAARIALGSLAAIGALSAPLLVKPMMDNLAYMMDKKEFWGKLEKEMDTFIKIPFRQLD